MLRISNERSGINLLTPFSPTLFPCSPTGGRYPPIDDRPRPFYAVHLNINQKQMETSDNRNARQGNNIENTPNRSGRVWGGLALLIIGGLLMARQAGADIPNWLFSWQMFPIAAGIYFGARQSFRPGGWLIPIAIGIAFLIDDFVPGIEMRHFIWPAIIIGAGLFMIFRPRGRRSDKWTSWKNDSFSSATNDSDEEVLDMVSIFGGNQRNVISKNFRGGEAVSIFGGTELILTQADFTGTATLELTQVFGGAKLVIPANWKIQSEVVSIFGALDDKRPQSQEGTDSSKVLKLIGTSIFGGIEIKSY